MTKTGRCSELPTIAFSDRVLQAQSMSSSAARVTNAFTIDVEDYFHVTAFAASLDRAQWDGLESRVERNTMRMLELLAKHNVRATFFVLGWVAERVPGLV